MVKVYIEVHRGAAHFDVGSSGREYPAGDESCEQTIPKEHRSCEVPDPERFFMEDRWARTGTVGLELPARVAA
jgi:hypothetical protein